MSDIFVSYARPDEPQAKRVADALHAQGYRVWRDDELPAHRAYAEVIEERLKCAKAVIVLWSAEAAKSQWVRAEADAARAAGILIQATLDGSIPPLPFNQIQCADLTDWNGSADSRGWQKLAASVAALTGPSQSPRGEDRKSHRTEQSVCVLPFANMSGDAEQEYFSDGISEDITTDLSKISALSVIARNTAFTFKGQSLDVCEIARKLGVSHVLEGSVRKSGGRVRITAQLIDGASGDHVWADRYDRDLTDIFAIQDEISKAIVAELKVKLLPEEKKAIENRGTTNVEAYNLYLMARREWVEGTYGDSRRDETIVRICRQATSLDPNYAQAWALMALAQAELRFWHGKDENALPAAERAIKIDPNIPEAHCVKARYLEEEGTQDEADAAIAEGLRLDPESWEVNREAARMMFRNNRLRESVPFFEKAASLMPLDFHNPSMLLTCYKALGDQENLDRVARMALERTKAALAKDPTNVAAIAAGVGSVAVLGEEERAREWIQRGMLLDPENLSMRYNFACVLVVDLHDHEAALDLLQGYFDKVISPTMLKHCEADPDWNAIRDHPRFKEMLAAAYKRLRLEKRAGVIPAAT